MSVPPESPTRVLVLGSTFPATPGDGTPEFVLTLSADLAARGYQVTAVVPRVPGGVRSEVIDGVQVRRFAYFPRRWEDLADGAIMPNLKEKKSRWLQAPCLAGAFLFAAIRESRRQKSDLVHAHWVIPAGIIARLLRKPYLVTAHGADAYTLRKPPFSWLKTTVLKHAVATVPVSEAIGAELGKLGITVAGAVPMGVDIDAITTEIGVRRTVPGRIVLVGRLVEKKGVDVLLRALAQLPDGTLQVIGDGPSRAALEELTATLGLSDRVEFLGQQPRKNVLATLATAAIVALPSKVGEGGDTDGVPVVLGEAMASGVPVVTSDAGGLSEHVEDGVNGRLVAAGSVDELREALRDMLADPEAAERRALAARERMVNTLGLDAVGGKYAAIIESALNQKAGAR